MGLFDSIKDAASSVADKVGDGIDKAKKTVSSIAKKVEEAPAAIAHGAGQALDGVKEIGKNFVKDPIGTIKSGAKQAWKGRYRGQTQKWYALRFTGEESEIDIDTPAGGHEPEFVEWRWEPMRNLPDLVIPFKRAVYQSFEMPLAAHLDMVSSHMAVVIDTPEHKALVDAFLRRRRKE